MPNKKFKIVLRFKDHEKLGDWGIGKGVIGVVEAEVPEAELDNPMATYALHRTGERHLQELIDIIIEEA